MSRPFILLVSKVVQSVGPERLVGLADRKVLLWRCYGKSDRIRMDVVTGYYDVTRYMESLIVGCLRKIEGTYLKR